MVKKIKKTKTTPERGFQIGFPRGPNPLSNNYTKKIIRYRQALDECKNEWANELEQNRFDIDLWYSKRSRNQESMVLLIEIMKEKIDSQRKELKKIKKSERRR